MRYGSRGVVVGTLAMMLAVFGATVVAWAEESPPAGDPVVRKAIETFQPEWVPPRGELQGMVVLLHPVGHAKADAAQRKADEAALRTAGYLLHLVRGGSGTPGMTRTDAAELLGEADGKTAPALAGLVEDAKPHFVVSIAVVPADRLGGKPLVRTWSGDDLALAMADAVAKAVGGETGASAPLELLRGPGVTVLLPLCESPADAAAVPFHRVVAERIYRGLVAYVSANRDGIEKNHLVRWASTGASRIDPAGVRPLRTDRDKFEAAVRAIVPAGDLAPAQAAWFCSMYRRTALTDTTIIHFEPSVVLDGETVVLRGTTTVPSFRETLAAALRLGGVKAVRNEMRVLPEDAGFGEQAFGACSVSSARTYAKPTGMSVPQTQILYGEPLFLLDRANGWLLVQAGDGYWGWVREGVVKVMSRDEFARYMGSEQAVVLHDLDIGDMTVVPGSRLPIGARLPNGLTLHGPDGRRIEAPAGAARLVDDASIASERPRIAMKLLYTPYVFGSRSPLGLDCSGLVNNLMEQAGLPAARDATQQLLSGKLVATRWYRDAMRPGDRIYFVDSLGKVFHAGVAITPTHFVHSSPPAVQISSLRKGDRLYEEPWDRQFFAAKRP